MAESFEPERAQFGPRGLARGGLCLGAVRPARQVAALSLGLALGACSVGQGDGEVSGQLTAVDCDLELADYDMAPSFFGGQVTGPALLVRVQRGSRLEMDADGLFIHVADVNDIRNNRVGLSIPLGGGSDAPVQIVAYFNETCLTGFPDEFRAQPLILSATSGEIVFDAVYAPDIDPGPTRIAARITGATFVDPDNPDGRHASLDGWFDFFYQRGRPAQRFP